MNFKGRIKSIEEKIYKTNQTLCFSELLKPEFVYKGEAFNDINKMYEKLNIIEIPSFFNDSDVITLLEKRLITVSSIFGQELVKKALKEIESNS